MAEIEIENKNSNLSGKKDQYWDSNEKKRIDQILDIMTNSYQAAMDSTLKSFNINKTINIIIVIIGIFFIGSSLIQFWLGSICIDNSNTTINQENITTNKTVTNENKSNSCKTLLNNNFSLYTTIFSGTAGVVIFITLFFFNTQERIHTALAKLTKSQIIYKDHVLHFEEFKDFETFYHFYLAHKYNIMRNTDYKNATNVNEQNEKGKDVTNNSDNSDNDDRPNKSIQENIAEIMTKKYGALNVTGVSSLLDPNATIDYHAIEKETSSTFDSDKVLKIDMSIMKNFHDMLTETTQKYVNMIDSSVEVKNYTTTEKTDDSSNTKSTKSVS